MTKVLVTGGAGFIGFHLCKFLANEGYEVTILDNFARAEEDADFKKLITLPNVNFIKGDITDPSTFNSLSSDFDFVYHLAAINGTENFYTIPDKVLKVGVLGTINLLEWFTKQKKGKLLFSSSSENYSGALALMGERFPIPTPENVPLVIDDPSNARWSYAAGKIVSEVAIHAYAKSRGLKRFSIIRYHNIYGPRMGNEHVIPAFIERILKEENPLKIFGGDDTRSFCYVEDAVNATRHIMESDQTDGRTIHIGMDRDEIKIVDLAKELCALAGVSPALDVLPSPPGSVKRRCPDVSLLRSLNFEPQISLAEGLKRTLEWNRTKFKS